MIRKLNVEDTTAVLEFLSEDAAFNLFIIGDILNTGFEEPYMDLWGDFSDQGILHGVLLRYFDNFIPYFKEDYAGEMEEFKEIISSHKDKKLISGKYDVAEKFIDALNNKVVSRKFFCELRDKSKLMKDDGRYVINIASVEDVDRLADFIDSIEEFRTTGENREMLRRSIETETGRFYYIENEEGTIVSTAGTSAENRYAAMVVSVATHKDYRRRGMAVNCISKLCTDVLKNCGSICLFYDNPEAGKIYHGIGFETIGSWMIAVEE